MNAWLKLIRWKNLAFVFIIQFVLWYCVIQPAVAHTNHILGHVNFLLLSLSTILIVSGGYIINDYFDIAYDARNNPQKVILDTQLHRRNAIILHSIFNFLGVALAFYIAHKAHKEYYVILQLLCTLFLWFYSTKFKRQFFIGNYIVAFMSSLTVWVLWLYEPSLHQIELFKWSQFKIGNPIFILAAYSFFAFMFTLLREMVKDLSNAAIAEQEGFATLAIRWGQKKTIKATQILTTLIIAAGILGVLYLVLDSDYWLAIYCTVTILIPMAYWSYTLPKALTPEHFKKKKRALKWMMTSGVFALVLNYLIHELT